MYFWSGDKAILYGAKGLPIDSSHIKVKNIVFVRRFSMKSRGGNEFLSGGRRGRWTWRGMRRIEDMLESEMNIVGYSVFRWWRIMRVNECCVESEMCRRVNANGEMNEWVNGWASWVCVRSKKLILLNFYSFRLMCDMSWRYLNIFKHR